MSNVIAYILRQSISVRSLNIDKNNILKNDNRGFYHALDKIKKNYKTNRVLPAEKDVVATKIPMKNIISDSIAINNNRCSDNNLYIKEYFSTNLTIIKINKFHENHLIIFTKIKIMNTSIYTEITMLNNKTSDMNLVQYKDIYSSNIIKINIRFKYYGLYLIYSKVVTKKELEELKFIINYSP